MIKSVALFAALAVGSASAKPMWEDIFVFDCNGAAHIMPSSETLQMGIDGGILHKAYNWAVDKMHEQAKCRCESLTDEQLKAGFTPDFENVLRGFSDEPRTDYSNCQMDNTTRFDRTLDMWHENVNVNVVMPDTCTYARWKEGKPCNLKWDTALDVELGVTIAECPADSSAGKSHLPYVAMNCLGDRCADLFRPCSSNSDCGTGGVCSDLFALSDSDDPTTGNDLMTEIFREHFIPAALSCSAFPSDSWALKSFDMLTTWWAGKSGGKKGNGGFMCGVDLIKAEVDRVDAEDQAENDRINSLSTPSSQRQHPVRFLASQAAAHLAKTPLKASVLSMLEFAENANAKQSQNKITSLINSAIESVRGALQTEGATSGGSERSLLGFDYNDAVVRKTGIATRVEDILSPCSEGDESAFDCGFLEWDGKLTDGSASDAPERLSGEEYPKWAQDGKSSAEAITVAQFGCDAKMSIMPHSPMHVSMNILDASSLLNEVGEVGLKLAQCRDADLTPEQFNARYWEFSLGFLLHYYTVHAPFDLGPEHSDVFSHKIEDELGRDVYDEVLNEYAPRDGPAEYAKMLKMVMPSTCTFEEYLRTGTCAFQINDLDDLVGKGSTFRVVAQQCADKPWGAASVAIECVGGGCAEMFNPTFQHCAEDAASFEDGSCVVMKSDDLFGQLFWDQDYTYENGEVQGKCRANDKGTRDIIEMMEFLSGSPKTAVANTPLDYNPATADPENGYLGRRYKHGFKKPMAMKMIDDMSDWMDKQKVDNEAQAEFKIKALSALIGPKPNPNKGSDVYRPDGKRFDEVLSGAPALSSATPFALAALSMAAAVFARGL